jgi:hypothetical protein
MTKSKFTENYNKHKFKLPPRHRIISEKYIDGITKADIARWQEVTPQFIGALIKRIENKFIKWNSKKNS